MRNEKIYDIYNVENGDSLYGISKKFNINPDLLSLINGLNTNDYIYSNQKIYVPKKGYSYYYTVMGDRINVVLDRFDIDYKSFLELNDNVYLEEGQIFAFKR